MRNYHLQIVAGLLVAVLAGCKSKDERPTPIGQTATTPGTVDDIKDKPLQYVGRTMTVAGEVDKVFADNTFEIEGDGIIWEKKLLVLTKSPVKFGPTSVRDDDDVVVRGTIKQMAPAALEAELGRDLPAEVEQKYADQPVLVADDVRLVDAGFRWSEDVKEGAIVSVVRILSTIAPKTLAGTDVDLDDVPVHAKAGTGIWIGPSTQSQLFVVPTDPATLASIVVGDRVDLKGTIREMPALGDATKRFELDPVTATRIATEPVYIDATELTESTLPPSS